MWTFIGCPVNDEMRVALPHLRCLHGLEALLRQITQLHCLHLQRVLLGSAAVLQAQGKACWRMLSMHSIQRYAYEDLTHLQGCKRRLVLGFQLVHLLLPLGTDCNQLRSQDTKTWTAGGIRRFWFSMLAPGRTENTVHLLRTRFCSAASLTSASALMSLILCTGKAGSHSASDW